MRVRPNHAVVPGPPADTPAPSHAAGRPEQLRFVGREGQDCKRCADDQIEWLDNSTVLYGLPRDGSELGSDIWSIRTDPSAALALFIEHASSPAVVR